MKPKLSWVYRRETDILARFKEMGWVPPSEGKHEGITGGNTGGRKPGSSSQDPGHHQVEHKPLEASGGGSGDPCLGDRATVWDLGSETCTGQKDQIT